VIYVCSFCPYFGEPPDINPCPMCGNPTLREATDWEMFMGHKLTHEDELAIRERVKALLEKEGTN